MHVRCALVPVLLAAVLGTAGCRPNCRMPAGGLVVLSDAPGLCSTADARQQRWMRDLARGVAPSTDLAVVTVDYPLDETIFPPDIAAPTILWHDDDPTAERWLVDVALDGGRSHIYALLPGGPPQAAPIDPRCVSETNEIYPGTEYQQTAESWRPDPQLWTTIKEGSRNQPATITLFGLREGRPHEAVSRGRVQFTTSRDPVGAPIFYRDVPLMPAETEEGVIKPLAKGAVPLIDWRLRDVGRDDSRILLRDMPTCANCHSFSRDGTTLGMDVDGPQGDKGAYAIVDLASQTVIDDDQVITWNAFRGNRTGLNTLGFLARLSPDGQHSIATVNESLYVRNFWDYKFGQVFFPTRGILATYSRADETIEALPGADDPEYVHCNPVWTPDGQTIIFARAPAKDPYDPDRPSALYAGDPNETQIRYDLYRIPFNGGRGGRPEPIAGASDNGMSNSFPKVSPDGRWIVFVKARNGQLMRPDGRLWIVPVEGGEAREMRCNTPLMNSWHSFSPNGRWIVFSSKSNTPYTQMFLTHIDEEGNDSPAVLIENSTASNRAVNLPEFVNLEYDDLQGISVPAVDHYLHFKRGTELAQAGRHDDAVLEFRKALKDGPQPWRVNDWRIHENLSKTLLQLGDAEGSMEHVRQALRLNPYNSEMQANLGYLLSEQGEFGQALEHLDIAIRLHNRDPRLWANRARLRMQLGDTRGATEDISQAIRRYPDDPDYWFFRALARRQAGDTTGALEDLDQALQRAPGTWPQREPATRLREELARPR